MTDAAKEATMEHPCRFRERLRVRWAEVDMQKIVFNGHYLMYLDTAMAGYWRALALDYSQSMAAWEGELFVKKAGLEYHASAEYDDMLEVGLRCAGMGNSSLRFEASVRRDQRLLVQGELIYVFADPVAKRSRPLPPELRAALQAFEAGEPMQQVQTGGWSECGRQASAIRKQVLMEEQGIDLPLAADAADEHALHVLVRNRQGFAQATGRLMPAQSGIGWLGRLAVRRPLRGTGLGRAALHALVAAARQRGDRAVRLHAQASAMAFYRNAGFSAVGEPFVEAGIVHQTLELTLQSGDPATCTGEPEGAGTRVTLSPGGGANQAS